MSVKDGLGCISEFIGIAKEISKIPRMVMPDYRQCSIDLYQICQKIQTPNDRIIECFNKFLYFDFSSPNARINFNNLVSDYNNIRSQNLRQFKFSCNDLGSIYNINIKSKMGKIFSNESKLEDAKGIFEKLTNADIEMIETLDNHILKKLDEYIADVEKSIENSTPDWDDAERKRLEFKLNCKEMIKEMQNFSDELTELTMTFAKIGQVPLTLDRNLSM